MEETYNRLRRQTVVCKLITTMLQLKLSSGLLLIAACWSKAVQSAVSMDPSINDDRCDMSPAMVCAIRLSSSLIIAVSCDTSVSSWSWVCSDASNASIS